MILSDKKLRELAKSKKITGKLPQKEVQVHPYIKQMANLETLIKSNDQTKILEYVAKMMDTAHSDNLGLLKQIATLHETLTKLTDKLILDDNNDVWVATIEERDFQRLIKKVEFKKVTGGYNA